MKIVRNKKKIIYWFLIYLLLILPISSFIVVNVYAEDEEISNSEIIINDVNENVEDLENPVNDIQNISNTKTINGKTSDSVGVGDTFKVQLKISSHKNIDYKVVDKLPEGFSYILAITENNKNSQNNDYSTAIFKLYDDKENVIAVVEEILNKEKIDLISTKDNETVLGSISLTEDRKEMSMSFNEQSIDSSFFVFEYCAQLEYSLDENGNVLSGPIIGKRGNQTGAVLTYVDATTNETVTESFEDATIYTYGIQIFNTDGEDGLFGAEFTVYRNAETTDMVGVITIGEDGVGTLNYLSVGTYYIKQTTPPYNYQINSEVISISVGSNDTNGGIMTFSDSVNDYSIATFANTVPISLPYTGSSDTVIYIAIGVLFITSSVVFLLIYRKNQEQLI